MGLFILQGSKRWENLLNDYYYNNLVSTLVVAKACQDFAVKRFIFSSIAIVYGDNKARFVESMISCLRLILVVKLKLCVRKS